MSFEIGWTDEYPWWRKPLGYWRLLRARRRYGMRLRLQFRRLRTGLATMVRKPGYQDLLHRLRNVHEGQRCFVLGNGSSLKRLDLSLLRDEITIGSNEVYRLFSRMGFHTSYLTVYDPVFAEEMQVELRRVEGPVKVFGLDTAHCVSGGRDVLFVDVCGGNGGGSRFSDDVSSVLNGGDSAAYMNLQFAYHLGCNPVYLVGTDFGFDGVEGISGPGTERLTEGASGDLSKRHFDPGFFRAGMRVRVPDTGLMEEEYEEAGKFYRSHGRHLVDVTPGGQHGSFDQLDYDGVLSGDDAAGPAPLSFGIDGTHFSEVRRLANPRKQNDRSERHYQKALRLCKAGSPELALGHLDRSMRARPNSLALYMSASLMKSLGRTKEAAKRFDGLLANHSLHLSREVFAGAHFHLGELLFRGGSYSEAREHFLRCLEVIPLHKKASGYLRVISAERCGIRGNEPIESCVE